MKAAVMLGRLSNGAERDKGRVVHGVDDSMPDYGQGKALCGAEPGRRSVGWHLRSDLSITCPRCLRIASGGGRVVQLRTVNKALAAAGIRAELIRAREGYHYFVGEDVEYCYSTSVYTVQTSRYSVEQWLTYAREFKAETVKARADASDSKGFGISFGSGVDKDHGG